MSPTQLLRALHVAPEPAGPHGAVPSGRRYTWWQVLMTHAADADAPEVQALAGVIAAGWEAQGLHVLPIAGLTATETRHLLTRWFPGVETELELDWLALAKAPRTESRYDEVEDLVSLLLGDGGTVRAPHDEVRWVAHALGQGSLGENHLWQDLHLPSRRELSALIAHWYPVLSARNDRNMKWKKFFYKQLCDKADINICRAPTCGVCSDYANCYGPEDAVAA